MAKKRQFRNRDGRVKKTKADEPAQFEAGGSAAPKNFDSETIAKDLGLYWEQDGGDNYILNPKEGVWSKWTKEATISEILSHKEGFLARGKAAGRSISMAEEVLRCARIHRCVKEFLPALAGYKVGLQSLPDGKQIIVRDSFNLIKPKKVPWPTVKQLIDGRLNLALDDGPGGTGGGGIDQTPWWHAWHRISYESLAFGEPGSFKPGHLLVVAGPAGCGKSRLQVSITTPLLGGRTADPTPYLNGEDIFNGDIAGSEHLMMEELLTQSQKSVDRATLGEAFKRLIVNESRRMRLMKTDPITVNPFTRASLTMNNDVDTLRAFPLLTPTFRGKVLMLLSASRPLPMPTETAAQQKAFNATLQKELPGYIWWLLNEFEIPDHLKVDDENERWARFGFSYFQHHELSMALFDDTPAAKLLQLIDAAEFVTSKASWKRPLWELPSVGGFNDYDHEKAVETMKARGLPYLEQSVKWEGSADSLTDLLLGEKNEDMTSSVARAAKALLRHGDFDRLLGRLAQDRPDRVVHKRTGTRGRFWQIFKPKTTSEAS